MKFYTKLVSAILVSFMLVACGLKGPLYHPSEKNTASASFSSQSCVFDKIV